MKLPLSVSIISYNEEKNLPKTLLAIADIAQEIILVDSFSTDKTLEIAKSFNCTIISHQFENHIAQKNVALSHCTQDWILSLDCDEEVSPDLKNSIIEAINNPQFDGYKINRKTFYLGKLLNYAWQPDWNLRLVKKSALPIWKGLNPHDELKIIGEIAKLIGHIIHYSYKDLNNHFEKTIYYAKLSGATYYEKGRKFSYFNLLLNPIVAFVRLYFVRMGFLDGFRGLAAGFSTYAYTFLKYLFLWEKWNRK